MPERAIDMVITGAEFGGMTDEEALARIDDIGVAGHGAGTQESSSATTSGCPHSPGKHGQPFGSVPMSYAQTCAKPKLRRPDPSRAGAGLAVAVREMQRRGHRRRTRP